jgi:hypothetical protein
MPRQKLSEKKKLAKLHDYRKRYYQAHRKELLQYQKDYLASHPELANMIKEKRNFRYATDPVFREKRKQYNRQYFVEHPDARVKFIGRFKERYRNDPDFRSYYKNVSSERWFEQREMKKNESTYRLILVNFERLSPNYKILIEHEIKKRNAEVMNNACVKTKEKPIHKYN